MDAKHDAVDRALGLRNFSWARFAVMMALIGTPCSACAWLFVRQPAPDRAQAEAVAQAASRPLVIVIPGPLAATPHQGAQDAAPTPAPSHVTTSLSPAPQKPAVPGSEQSRTAPHVAQLPTAQPSGVPTGEVAQAHAAVTADAREHVAETPATLAGSVIQTAASNPAVPQLPPLPGPGEAPSAPVGPPPSPSLVVPAPGSGSPDARKPLLPSSAPELPAPDMLPTGVLPTGVLPTGVLPTGVLPTGVPSSQPMPTATGSSSADAPQPTEQEREAIRNHIEGVVDPSCTLDLVQGRTRLLKLKKPARSVHVTGTEVVSCTPVSSREIAIQARAVGTTLLHLTFGEGETAPEVEVRYLVRVVPALTVREPYEAVFRALETEIAGMFPESKVQLKLVGEAVLVTGQVREARDATAIVQLVVANTPWADRHAATVAGSSSPHVINRLQIGHAAPHQLALKVAVVELSRSAFGSLCGKGPGAAPDTNYSAGAIVPVVYDVSDSRMAAAWGAATVSSVKPANGTDGRPILLLGQPARLMATGQCLVSAAPDKTLGEQHPVKLALQGIELSFTPVGVEGESLRMTVAASAGQPSAGQPGAGQPGAGRPFQSTIAMRAGQTFAFTGLLSPAAAEHDPQRAAGRRSLLGRFVGVEQPAAAERQTIVLILPEAVGSH